VEHTHAIPCQLDLGRQLRHKEYASSLLSFGTWAVMALLEFIEDKRFWASVYLDRELQCRLGVSTPSKMANERPIKSLLGRFYPLSDRSFRVPHGRES